MNIMDRVTWKTMGKNRVRTVVTIIGIILSTAMFTGVTTIIASLFTYFRDIEIAQSGNYHICARRLPGDIAAEASADSRVECAALLKTEGYAKIASGNPDKPYICVLAADEAFVENMPIRLTEGRLPETAEEIIVPAHLSSNGGVTLALGEETELTLGERVSVSADEPEDAAEPARLGQGVGYLYEDERLVGEKTAKYTVVGFYERPDFEPFQAPGYSVLTKLVGGAAADGFYDCYFRVRDPKHNLEPFGKQYCLAGDGAELHDGLLALEGYTRYDNINRVMTNFAIILCVLIFIGSVSLIYSAFSISVSERTKQFGLLSSVGATRSQIRSSVLTEALTLSAIGIPLGVLSGIGGIALTLYLLRDKFGSLIGANDVPIHVSVTWQAIAIAAAVALLTVLVSAWIPSGRAMRISPIEAIRQSRDVKAKGKSREKSRLFTKLFGAEGVLASKYYARSRKKYRATIVSLAMSVILFISASAFCMYITRSVDAADNRMNFDGAYYGLIPTGDYERLRPALSEIAPDICAYIYEPRNGDFCYLPADSFTGEYLSYLDELEEGVFASPNVYVFYLDDAAFRALLAKNGLPESDYFGEGADKALLVNHATGTVYKEGTRVSYVFDLLRPGTETVRIGKLPEEEAIPDGYEYGGVCWTGSAFGEGELRACYQPDGWEDPQFDELGRPKDQPMLPLEYEEVRIGAMLAEQPTGSFATGMINIIRPFSQYSGELTTAHFYFRSSSVSASIEKMAELLDANGIKATENDFYDVTEENRLMNNVVTIIKVFSYGFIALISLISVANVFNTVTTNVALRRRDYAMLRSMGMTKKGMNRMSNYECLIYGSRSLLIGLPAAAAVTYLVFLAAKGAANMPFTLPWTAIAIAVASVFLVVFVSMLYSTGKLKKDNPIDALKDENI